MGDLGEKGGKFVTGQVVRYMVICGTNVLRV